MHLKRSSDSKPFKETYFLWITLIFPFFGKGVIVIPEFLLINFFLCLCVTCFFFTEYKLSNPAIPCIGSNEATLIIIPYYGESYFFPVYIGLHPLLKTSCYFLEPRVLSIQTSHTILQPCPHCTLPWPLLLVPSVNHAAEHSRLL